MMGASLYHPLESSSHKSYFLYPLLEGHQVLPLISFSIGGINFIMNFSIKSSHVETSHCSRVFAHRFATSGNVNGNNA